MGVVHVFGVTVATAAGAAYYAQEKYEETAVAVIGVATIIGAIQLQRSGRRRVAYALSSIGDVALVMTVVIASLWPNFFKYAVIPVSLFWLFRKDLANQYVAYFPDVQYLIDEKDHEALLALLEGNDPVHITETHLQDMIGKGVWKQCIAAIKRRNIPDNHDIQLITAIQSKNDQLFQEALKRRLKERSSNAGKTLQESDGSGDSERVELQELDEAFRADYKHAGIQLMLEGWPRSAYHESERVRRKWWHAGEEGGGSVDSLDKAIIAGIYDVSKRLIERDKLLEEKHVRNMHSGVLRGLLKECVEEIGCRFNEINLTTAIEGNMQGLIRRVVEHSTIECNALSQHALEHALNKRWYDDAWELIDKGVKLNNNHIHRLITDNEIDRLDRWMSNKENILDNELSLERAVETGLQLVVDFVLRQRRGATYREDGIKALRFLISRECRHDEESRKVIAAKLVIEGIPALSLLETWNRTTYINWWDQWFNQWAAKPEGLDTSNWRLQYFVEMRLTAFVKFWFKIRIPARQGAQAGDDCLLKAIELGEKDIVLALVENHMKIHDRHIEQLRVRSLIHWLDDWAKVENLDFAGLNPSLITHSGIQSFTSRYLASPDGSAADLESDGIMSVISRGDRATAQALVKQKKAITAQHMQMQEFQQWILAWIPQEGVDISYIPLKEVIRTGDEAFVVKYLEAGGAVPADPTGAIQLAVDHGMTNGLSELVKRTTPKIHQSAMKLVLRNQARPKAYEMSKLLLGIRWGDKEVPCFTDAMMSLLYLKWRSSAEGRQDGLGLYTTSDWLQRWHAESCLGGETLKGLSLKKCAEFGFEGFLQARLRLGTDGLDEAIEYAARLGKKDNVCILINSRPEGITEEDVHYLRAAGQLEWLNDWVSEKPAKLSKFDFNQMPPPVVYKSEQIHFINAFLKKYSERTGARRNLKLHLGSLITSQNIPALAAFIAQRVTFSEKQVKTVFKQFSEPAIFSLLNLKGFTRNTFNTSLMAVLEFENTSGRILEAYIHKTGSSVDETHLKKAKDNQEKLACLFNHCVEISDEAFDACAEACPDFVNWPFEGKAISLASAVKTRRIEEVKTRDNAPEAEQNAALTIALKQALPEETRAQIIEHLLSKKANVEDHHLETATQSETINQLVAYMMPLCNQSIFSSKRCPLGLLSLKAVMRCKNREFFVALFEKNSRLAKVSDKIANEEDVIALALTLPDAEFYVEWFFKYGIKPSDGEAKSIIEKFGLPWVCADEQRKVLDGLSDQQRLECISMDAVLQCGRTLFNTMFMDSRAKFFKTIKEHVAHSNLHTSPVLTTAIALGDQESAGVVTLWLINQGIQVSGDHIRSIISRWDLNWFVESVKTAPPSLASIVGSGNKKLFLDRFPEEEGAQNDENLPLRQEVSALKDQNNIQQAQYALSEAVALNDNDLSQKMTRKLIRNSVPITEQHILAIIDKWGLSWLNDVYDIEADTFDISSLTVVAAMKGPPALLMRTLAEQNEGWKTAEGVHVAFMDIARATHISDEKKASELQSIAQVIRCLISFGLALDSRHIDAIKDNRLENMIGPLDTLSSLNVRNVSVSLGLTAGIPGLLNEVISSRTQAELSREEDLMLKVIIAGDAQGVWALLSKGFKLADRHLQAICRYTPHLCLMLNDALEYIEDGINLQTAVRTKSSAIVSKVIQKLKKKQGWTDNWTEYAPVALSHAEQLHAKEVISVLEEHGAREKQKEKRDRGWVGRAKAAYYGRSKDAEWGYIKESDMTKYDQQ